MWSDPSLQVCPTVTSSILDGAPCSAGTVGASPSRQCSSHSCEQPPLKDRANDDNCPPESPSTGQLVISDQTVRSPRRDAEEITCFAHRHDVFSAKRALRRCAPQRVAASGHRAASDLGRARVGGRSVSTTLRRSAVTAAPDTRPLRLLTPHQAHPPVLESLVDRSTNPGASMTVLRRRSSNQGRSRSRAGERFP